MKLAIRILLGVVVLLVLVGAAAVLFIDSLARKAVERGGTHALGVETRLEDASIGLMSGEFSLQGLAVANPPGFEHPDFFALRSAELELPLGTLLEDRITIPLLALEGITIDLERNDKGTNYGVILDNLKRFESPGGAPPEEGAPGKKFLLQKLIVREVRAAVNLVPIGGDLTKLSFSVPEIVVEDVGSEMTLSEICALVVKVVIQAAIEAGGDKLPAELLADLRGRLEGLESLAHEKVGAELGKVEERLQEHAEKLGPEAEKALKDASEKLDEKLDDLFKKKKD